MADALRSSDWYRVAALKPRLRRHAQVQRHMYRGELWYVLQDPASQRSHRLSEEAYYPLIGQFRAAIRFREPFWNLVRFGTVTTESDL